MTKQKLVKAIGIATFVFAVGFNIQYAFANYDIALSKNGNVLGILAVTSTGTSGTVTSTDTSGDTSGGKIYCYSTYSEGSTTITKCNGCTETTAGTYSDQSTCKK
ncbi:hypothetical protein [Chitinophaga sp. LS1]|uniref:hypothetical protein n=1 Tax=Chitinophaga sp. LS1 TaxID=3051176 RepID=UPI002AAA656B|nr:hypothetical protein [Chitinophaga sp. LS1]WPV66696.1 hypothetical protein QQL36_33415 [Chitinophaga sp. LS1]